MHNCPSLLISCLDFRIQPTVEKWAKEHLGKLRYDRVALAGGVKSRDVILDQVDISVRLHHIKNVVLMNHEDCGAYGVEATEQKHREELRAATAAIKEKYPLLKVESYYVTLAGEVIASTAPK